MAPKSFYLISDLFLLPHLFGEPNQPVAPLIPHPIESRIGIFDPTPECARISREFASAKADRFVYYTIWEGYFKLFDIETDFFRDLQTLPAAAIEQYG